MKIEEQFNHHNGAQKRSYHQKELVWVRDYRPGHEKWIPARVKNRHGRAAYDVLTEEDDFFQDAAQPWYGKDDCRRHEQCQGSSTNYRAADNDETSSTTLTVSSIATRSEN
ncbi:hypothetical protein RB195_024780 [Necator americanus]|uniref:Uncharacterized protein n=1 Tax=Necator americanus TaxID=51031 RepID=A0ABR1EPV3_NECAM